MENSLPKTLYIIGNGFDLHHKLDTWYSSFGLFLRDHHSDIYEYFINYFGFPELDEDDEESLKHPLWSHFEASLAYLDVEEVLGEHADHAANPASDDFSDGDWDTIAIYVNKIRKDLTIKMVDLFKQFILEVEYPKKDDLDLLGIDKQALFFNFNYTKSLEHYYQIPKDQILYIHGRAESNDRLVLGHGMDASEFERQEEVPPEGLTDEQLEQWREEQSDAFDYSIERGRDELIQYLSESFKPTADLIKENKSFFNSLLGIENVYVLGHSLADVDSQYLEKIIASVGNNNSKWYVSYYNEAELEERKKKLFSLGLKEEQISLLTMNEIK